MLESELSIFYCYRDTRNVKFKEIFELFLEMIADPKRTILLVFSNFLHLTDIFFSIKNSASNSLQIHICYDLKLVSDMSEEHAHCTVREKIQEK